MTVRSLRFFVEVCAGLLAGLVILVAAAVWRLSAGPIELDFLTPSLEEALNGQDLPFKFDVGKTVLTWGGWDRAVDIVAQDVKISPRELGRPPVAVLPEISIGFSLEALREAKVAPTTLELLHPKFSLKRNRKGDWGIVISTGDGQGTSDDDAKTLMEMLAGFGNPDSDQGSFGYLRHITFVDATVTIDDQLRGQVWDASVAKLDLERSEFGVALEFAGLLQLDGTTVDLTLLASKNFGSDIFHLTFDSPYLDPAMIRGAFPDYADYAARLPNLSASGDADIRDDGWPERAELSFQSDIGSLALQIAPSEPEVAGARQYQAGLAMENFRLEDWIAVLPEGMLNGTVMGTAKGTGQLEVLFPPESQAPVLKELGFALATGDGQADLPDLYHEPLAFNAIRLSGAVADNGGRIALESLEIDLPQGRLAASASSEMVETGRTVSLEAALSDFNFNLLEKYWPESLGEDARAWVIPNMPEAVVPEAKISLSGLLGAGEGAAFELTGMGGEIEMHDAIVDYLNPLPPVKGVSGHAAFGENWFDIDVHSGHVGNLELTGGKIKILDIGGDDRIDIALDIEGPFRETLELVDHEPLRLVSGIGFDPGTVGAQAVGNVRLVFPLINDLDARDIAVTAEARLAGLVMEDAFQGRPVQGNDLFMKVNNDGFTVAGDVTLEEVPLQVTWTENFGDDEPMRKELSAEGRIDDQILRSFGYSVAPVIEGAADVRLTSREFRDGSQRLEVVADLSDAGMLIRPLNWMKPRTYPATLSLTALLDEGQPVALNQVRFSEETLDMELDMTLSEQGDAVQSVVMRRLVLDGSNISGRLELTEDHGYVVSLEGDRFDLTGVIDQALAELELEKLSEEDQPATPFHITAKFTELTAIPKRRLGPSAIEIRHDGSNVQLFKLDSTLDDLSDLHILYGPEGGGYALTVTAGNAGTAFRNLNLFDRIEGGKLTVTGRRDNVDAPLTGHVEMNKYTLVKAPIMAKVLEFMSLTGILTSLTDKGLPFSKFEADYSLEEGVLSFAKARAFSPSIGISISGKYDLENDMISAKGTVAPANAINQVLNIIPVVGWLLTGGEDGGFLGANYEVSGPMENPKISVNPLSALTPGALRKIFDIFPDSEPEKPGTANENSGG